MNAGSFPPIVTFWILISGGFTSRRGKGYVALTALQQHTYNIYMNTAKLFTTGGSQAVRLPKEYRFEGDEVLIRKEGKAVIIEPMPRRRWPRDFFKSIRINDRAFRRPDQGSLPPAPQL